MSERLHKVLANAGFGSRRKCEELIQQGRVEVDGQVVTQLGTKVDPDEQEIRCLGRRLQEPRKIYLALNKPANVICTTSDEKGRRTIMHLLPVRERVYPVGRLDRESEGLLIVTNDGELTNLLTHPRYGIEKGYHALLDGKLTPAIKQKIEAGVWLSEGKTAPCRIVVKKTLKEQTVVDITISEGLNREVRRIFAKFGLEVDRLKRIRIGPLFLGGLPRGACRPLTRAEVAGLKAYALRGGQHETSA